jgi:hypothetical protein
MQTTLELIRAFRARVMDDGGDLAQTLEPGNTYVWENPGVTLRWSNAEAMYFLTEAMREYARRRPIIDSTTPDLCELPIVAGQRRYPYAAAIIAILDVRLASTERTLKKRTRTWLNEFCAYWRTQTGVPDAYCEDEDRVITLDKEPVADDTLLLTVQRYPIDLPSWENRSNAPAEPAYDDADEALLQWMLHLAFTKRDTEVYDPTRGAQAAADFLGMVGPPKDAEALSLRRRYANLSQTVRPRR